MARKHKEAEPFYPELEEEEGLEDLEDRGDDLEDLDDEPEEEENLDDPEEEEEEDIEDDEPEEEDEDEPEEEEEPRKGKSDYRIPKARFDEVIAQREEERQRVAWLEEQLSKLIALQEKKEKEVIEVQEPDFDFEAAEEKYLELAFTGEHKEATALRRQIDKAREKVFEYKLTALKKHSEDHAVSKARETLDTERFATVKASAEKSYPFLNSKNKAYDPEAVEFINTLMKGHIASGKSKAEALELAVKKGAPMFTKDETAGRKVSDKRRIEQAGRNARASKQQPPRVSGKGAKEVNLETIELDKISDREWRTLTAKQKAALRGN